MSWQEMAKLFQKHVKAYMGSAVEVTETDGLSFVYVGHFRNFFYVYSYAYGELMSNIMTQKYYEDSSFIEKIDQFLCMGRSDTVENIFKSIGINANKTETFMESLKSLEKDIKEFEKLIK
jgi:oligoendopeptidase F